MFLGALRNVLNGVVEFLGAGGRRRLLEYLARLRRLGGRARAMLKRIALASDLKTSWKIEILSQAISLLPNPPSDDEVEQYLSALLRDYAFRRPTVYPKKYASRVLTAETFFNYYVDRSLYQGIDHFISTLREGLFPLSHLRGPISSGTRSVFFTETGAISSSTPLEALGLEPSPTGEYIELIFDPFSPYGVEVFVPTTADALAHPNFRPSPDGAAKGRTLNLHTGRVEDGVPEYVTRPFSPKRVIRIVYHHR